MLSKLDFNETDVELSRVRFNVQLETLSGSFQRRCFTGLTSDPTNSVKAPKEDAQSSRQASI